MPALVMAGDSSRTGPPSSSPPPLSFVTATSLSDFKNRDTMRQVRRAVMQTYLNKAENDPNSTDVRVRKKRPGSRNKKPSPPVQTPQAPQASQASSSSNPDPASVSRRKDSRIDDIAHHLVLDSSESYPTPRVSSDSSRAHSIRSLNPLEDSSVPSVSRAVATTISPAVSRAVPDNTEQEDVLDDDAALVPRRPLSEQHAFDVAYGAPYGLHLREVTPDPFASCAPLPNSDINVELLKYNCTAFFASRAMGRDWVPYLLSTPPAFLASLCVSASFSDVMAISHPQNTLPDRNRRQTLELLDVVPRMLNESLSDPSQGYSDANIAAVLQFLCGQMSSDNNALVPVHQAGLKHMVIQRGGLEKIGRTGVIPIHLSITDMEANFLRNEPADPMYLKYALNYVDTNPPLRSLVPESPLFSRHPEMKVVRSSKMCSMPTHRLVVLARQLTETFLKLGQIRSRREVEIGPAAYGYERAEARLKDNLRDIVVSIHDMAASTTPGHRGYNDQLYESVRLTSLLYAHAIWHGVPFHQAPHVRCTLDHKSDCKATPELIQQAISITNLGDAWERMAGVLYWVALVAGAACHRDLRTSHSEQGISSSATRSHGQHVSTPPASSESSFNRMRSGSAPVQQDQLIETTNLSLRQYQPSSSYHPPEHPGRLFQQYLNEQHLNTARTTMRTASFPSSGPSSRTTSPLHPAGPFSKPASTSAPQASRASPASEPSPPAEAAPSATKRGKRVRTSPPPPQPVLRGGVPPPRSREDDERSFLRNFLVANAMRCSILLRFEHTAAIASSVTTLGLVRDYLAAGRK